MALASLGHWLTAHPEYAEWGVAAGTLLTVIVLASAAVVAWRQVKEAKRLREEHQHLREEQARPFVVIDIEPWSPFVDLKITNVGKTMAQDVQFRFEPKLESVKDEQHGFVPVGETNLFKNGIASFPPGKQITLWFDHYPDRIEKGLPDRYDVEISYVGPSGKRYAETTILDLGMYRDIGEITRYGIHDVHGRLKEIATTLNSWTHPEGLKVLTRKERKQYAAEIREWQAERQRAAAEYDRGTADEAPSDDTADEER
jgi:hypothetical protein